MNTATPFPAADDWHSASGERVWTWIAVAFAVYWTLFVVGAYTGRQELNDVGAVCILATLGWATLERLWVRVDAAALACLAAILITLLFAPLSNTEKHPGAIIKFVSLYLVMALGRLLRLPVASGSRMRWVLAAQIILILMLSVTTDRGGVWDGGTRHSGLFANPNNLALIPFLLLFFIDRRRDRLPVHLLAHGAVIAMLIWTGTSGAMVAYAIGLTVHFYTLLPERLRIPVISLVALSSLVVIGLAAFGAEDILPETRITRQIAVMRSELDTVLAGHEVAYYEKERVLGPGAASGIWRLAHWRHAITIYAGGDFAEKAFGFGIGSSPDLLGKLPHNEYLRLLFEQGVVGLALFLFAWIRIVMAAPHDVRYCGLIVAIYSFSENNLDNFPFMALFILGLSAVDPFRAAVHAVRENSTAAPSFP